MEILSKVETTLKWTMRAKSKDWWNIWGIIWEPFLILGVCSDMTTNSLIQPINVRICRMDIRVAERDYDGKDFELGGGKC
jgi:hypothetical protein